MPDWSDHARDHSFFISEGVITYHGLIDRASYHFKRDRTGKL